MVYTNRTESYYKHDYIGANQVEDVVLVGFDLYKWLDSNPTIMEKLKSDRTFKLTKEMVGL